MSWLHSFRVRLLGVMLVVSVMPVAIVGLWITRSAARSGEDLLRARLLEAVDEVAGPMAQRWIEQRSLLLDVAEEPAVRRAVDPDAPPPADVAPPFTSARLPSRAYSPVILRDRANRAVREILSEADDEMPGPALPIEVPVHASALGAQTGTISAWIPLAALVPQHGVAPGSIGTLIGIFDAATGAPLVPLPFERSGRDGRATIEWGGDRWLAVGRVLADPSIEIVGAAPLSPFERPLRDAARSGVWLLLGVAAGGLALAGTLAAGMTRSLQRLAGAAEAVAEGALDRQVDARGATEIGRVARSFNRMTASLRQTLQALAEQRSLARLGEFAATLAHEVRNPLTAIRVDLQVVEESLPDDDRALRPLRRALDEIDRLDRTVGAALLATRAGRTDRAPVDLVPAVRAAAATAERSVTPSRAIPIEALPEPAWVHGDAAALQQLFLNVLLNALEAVRDGGEVRVAVWSDRGRYFVEVADTGRGLSPEAAAHAFDPLFTTRADGTGLGLTIAARLTHAHGGTIRLENAAGGGAVATIDLPAADLPGAPL